MPKRNHYDCCKCKTRITIVGPGMPIGWTEVKIIETSGGGMSGIGKRMRHQMAMARYCGDCWPRDWRIAHRVQKDAQAKLEALVG